MQWGWSPNWQAWWCSLVFFPLPFAGHSPNLASLRCVFQFSSLRVWFAGKSRFARTLTLPVLINSPFKARQISDSGSGIGETARFFRGAVVSWPPPESCYHLQQVQCRQSGPSRFFRKENGWKRLNERPRPAICILKPTGFIPRNRFVDGNRVGSWTFTFDPRLWCAGINASVPAL